MPYSRYTRTSIFTNKNKNYQKAFYPQRNVSQIVQFSTTPLTYPTQEMRAMMENIPLVWKATDTLYNIANQYYGSPEYWWVVAWYNQRSSEPEFKVGDIYYVPLPIEDVLGYF